MNENCWLKRMAIELVVGEAWEAEEFTHLANGIKREGGVGIRCGCTHINKLRERSSQNVCYGHKGTACRCVFQWMCVCVKEMYKCLTVCLSVCLYVVSFLVNDSVLFIRHFNTFDADARWQRPARQRDSD